MQCLSPAASLCAPPDAPDLSAEPPTLSEIFAQAATDGAAPAFVCAQLSGAAHPVLWVQDRLSRKETGRPYLAGLPPGLRLLHVSVSRPVYVLWALEQGLDCDGLSGVVGEVWGDPPALDFTATKRLALRAEARGLSCWLIRRAGSADLSAARMRWRLSSLPSRAEPDDPRAPGAPLWEASLFRARFRAPGAWVAGDDGRGLQFSHPRPRDLPGEAPAGSGPVRLMA